MIEAYPNKPGKSNIVSISFQRTLSSSFPTSRSLLTVASGRAKVVGRLLKNILFPHAPKPALSRCHFSG